MKVIDLKKTLKPLYAAWASKPSIVDVPPLRALMIDGCGDPNGADFEEAVGALYGVAYTLKFALKKAKVLDYPVMPLEGLWWADDPADFLSGRRNNWEWTVFIVVPDAVAKPDFLRAAKAKAKAPRFPEIRLARFSEGKAAQILHVGPYAAERPTIERLHRFIEERGLRLRGKHHEIYLGDPRRSAPDKLKTIIRHPVS